MLVRARVAFARALASNLPTVETESLARDLDPEVHKALLKSQQSTLQLRGTLAALKQQNEVDLQKAQEEVQSLKMSSQESTACAEEEQRLQTKLKEFEAQYEELQTQHQTALLEGEKNLTAKLSAHEEELQAHKEEFARVGMKLEETEKLQQKLAEQLELSEANLKRAEVDMGNAQEAAEAAAAASSSNSQEDHPIYGRLLSDFGFKKLFAVSPKTLCDKSLMPVWEKQRIFREERAKAIAKFKRKDDRFGLPGVISIFESDKNKRGILDGQHRVGGLELLMQSGDWPMDKPVLCEVYDVKEDKEISDLFLEINQAQPVQEMDLPGAADDTVRLAINETSSALKADFPEMFKESLRCRAPHVNIDNLRQALFTSEEAHMVVRDAAANGDSPSEKLLEWVRAKNSKLGERTDDEWKTFKSVTAKGATLAKHLAKSRKNDFFLGLDKDWLN